MCFDFRCPDSGEGFGFGIEFVDDDAVAVALACDEDVGGGGCIYGFVSGVVVDAW